MSNHVDIIVDDDRWAGAPGFEQWSETVDDLLDATVKAVYNGDMGFCVNLLLTGYSAVRTLNLDFRGMSSGTDVLSFPQYESQCIRDLLKDDGATRRLDDTMVGDIAMSFDDSVAKSIRYGTFLWDRCSHLLVHGALHLFGMDHVNDDEAEAMERREAKILESFGIRDPYVLVVNKQIERDNES
jgi:probable rRNA maturation factor